MVGQWPVTLTGVDEILDEIGRSHNPQELPSFDHQTVITRRCIRDASSIAVFPRNFDSSGGVLPALALALAG